MSYRARVYLQRPSEKAGTYLGEIDVDPRPVEHGDIRFMHRGKIEVGRIDWIAPDDWEKGAAVPTIYVVHTGPNARTAS
jgi:hypothetical protein